MAYRRAAASAALLAALTACDIPTELPLIDQRWFIPLEVVTLDQEEFLPASVTIANGVYDVDLTDAAASESLGNLCPACAPLDGLVAPTPAYQGTFVSLDALPLDVVSVDIVSGSVDIEITNGLTFDPLAGGGTLVLTVSAGSGGPVLGSLVLDGATDMLPPSSSLMRTVTLGPATVTGSIETRIDIDHVGGELAMIDVTDQVSFAATNTTIQVSSVTVDVDGRSASLTETALDVEDIDTDIVERVQGGAVVLDVVNPYGASFDGTVTVGSVVKSVSIPSTPTSTVEVSYSGGELQSFLGQPGVTFQGTGTLGGGPVQLTPTAELSIDTTVDLTIQVGG